MPRGTPSLFAIVGMLLMGAAVAVTVLKFSRPPAPEKGDAPVAVESAEVGGVKFEIEYKAGSELYKSEWGRDSAGVIRGTRDPERFDYQFGIPVVNGVGFAAPAPGDTVRWNLSGPLLVNGQPQQPFRFQPVELDAPPSELKWEIRGGSDAPRDSLSADWSRSGLVLVTAHGDGAARVWDVKGAVVRTFLTPPPPAEGRKSWGLKAAVSPDGKTVATANVQAGVVTLWEADTGKEVAKLTAPDGKVTDLRFAFDSCLLEARGGTLYARDLTGDRSKLTPLGSVHAELPASFAFAAGVLGANDGQRVRLTRPMLPGGPDGETRTATVEGVTDVGAMALSPDGSLLAVADGTGRLAFHDAATGKETRKLWWRRRNQDGVISRIGALAFLPDGKTLLVGAADSLRLYDVPTGRERGWVPTNTIRSLAVSGDGQFVAASAEHGPAVYVWRVGVLQPPG